MIQKIAVLSILLTIGGIGYVMAQPFPPTNVPIDGGATLLATAAGGYRIYKANVEDQKDMDDGGYWLADFFTLFMLDHLTPLLAP